MFSQNFYKLSHRYRSAKKGIDKENAVLPLDSEHFRYMVGRRPWIPNYNY